MFKMPALECGRVVPFFPLAAEGSPKTADSFCSTLSTGSGVAIGSREGGDADVGPDIFGKAGNGGVTNDSTLMGLALLLPFKLLLRNQLLGLESVSSWVLSFSLSLSFSLGRAKGPALVAGRFGDLGGEGCCLLASKWEPKGGICPWTSASLLESW